MNISIIFGYFLAFLVKGPEGRRGPYTFMIFPFTIGLGISHLWHELAIYCLTSSHFHHSKSPKCFMDFDGHLWSNPPFPPETMSNSPKSAPSKIPIQIPSQPWGEISQDSNHAMLTPQLSWWNPKLSWWNPEPKISSELHAESIPIKRGTSTPPRT